MALIVGTSGNDYLVGTAEADTLQGLAGDDTLLGNGGNDLLEGGEGWNLLRGFDGNDTLLGGAGGSAQYGNAGDDLLVGGMGGNLLEGGAGNDTLIGGGSPMVDTAVYSFRAAGRGVVFDGSAVGTSAVVNLADGLGSSDRLEGIDGLEIWGSNHADTLRGGTSSSMIFAGAGDDLLVGGMGADDLQGEAGNDTLIGGEGSDWARYDFWAAVSGVVFDGSAVGTSAAVNLSDGLGGTDRLEGIEALLVHGSEQADTLVAGAGDDHLIGRGGDDRMMGGAGNDTLDGGTGNDRLEGGTGADTYVLDTVGDVVVETGTAAAEVDTVYSAVSNTLGANVENLIITSAFYADGTGNGLNNLIRGGAFGGRLGGEAGDDTLEGGTSDDQLWGDTGNDLLLAGEGNDYLTGDLGNDTLVGGSGVDTASYFFALASAGVRFDGSGVGMGAVVDLPDGMGGIDRLDGIDRLYINGSNFADTITGGAGADQISGVGSAPDQLYGGAGSDYLLGGSGNDSLAGGEGIDSLVAGSGHDTLDGGPGADFMSGGGGNDTFIVDDVDDIALERTDVNEGIDTVLASVSIALRANVENLTLTGNALVNGQGNGLPNVITGNGAANFLMGHAGNDTLIGNAGADTLNGGTGVDRMEGGFGGDVYVVDDASDVVVERPGEGNDRVSTTVHWTLGANVEHLTLAATAGHIDGTGNELANLIQGNAGHNRLAGEAGKDTLTGGAGNDTLDGGSGADHLVGQEGDDTYFVDDAGDRTIESHQSFGIDIVITALSRTLSTNVEHLTLVGAAVTGAGNALANRITGNEWANTLLGVEGDDTLIGNAGNDTLNGGPGADRMEGGTCDDVYAVDSADDVVVELAGEGTDRVSSTVHWMLGENVENLTLAATAAINGTGNGLANVITGTPAANTIDGGAGEDTLSGFDGNDTLTGGAGSDRLSGGNGADHFRFVTTSDGVDTITDFASGSDKIEIVAANFGLVAGATANLVVNGNPTSGAAAFIYTSATGSLAFDADGSGPGAAVTLAMLSNKPATLLPGDFVIGP